MISVTQLQSVLTALKTACDFDYALLVATEDHIIKRLRDRTGTVLAMTYPSVDDDSKGIDNIADVDTIFVWVIEKINPSDVDETNEPAHYEKMRGKISDIKNYLRGKKLEGCNLLQFINENSFHIDPEYQIFGGWNGYSLSFTVKSPGY
jgi:predicted protein tyrosine phosphatase